MSGNLSPTMPASIPLVTSPSTSSRPSSINSRHSQPQNHRPAVRVLSSEEDLATRPVSTSTRARSPGPDQALSSRPDAQTPLGPTLNGLAATPDGPSFLGAQRRASSGGSSRGATEVGSLGARGSHAQARSPSPSPSPRPFSGSSSSWVLRDEDSAAGQAAARSSMTPNALSPRPRQHGPVITRVSSPMDPSFSPTDAPLDNQPASPFIAPSPYLAARPASRASTFTRRSSSDLLSTMGSPRLAAAPLSKDDVATDLATGGALAREHLASARRASEDSLASARAHGPLPGADTKPRAPSSSAPHETQPFTSLHVDPPRTSTSPPLAAPSAPAPTSRRAAAASGPTLLLHHPLTPVLSPHTSRPMRKYRLHPGRNKFLCGGRLMTGGDSALPLVGSLAVAVVLPAAWWVFNGRFLWESWGGEGKAGVLVFGYVVLVMWTSMLKTAFSDPGILPRNLDPTPPRKWVLHSTSHGGEGSASDGKWQVGAKWIRVKDGGVVASKWCETCKTYRPPRTSHCRLCDNCVERTDHHCAFLNACIGQRNYLPFIAFLVSAVVAGLYSLAFSAYHISQRASATQLRQWDTIGAIVVLIATFAFLVPVGGLAAYHAQLIWTNRTTIEMLRPAIARAALSPLTSEPISANPWTRRSGLRNVLAVLCAPGALAGRESWVDARGWAGRDEREEAVGGGKVAPGRDAAAVV